MSLALTVSLVISCCVSSWYWGCLCERVDVGVFITESEVDRGVKCVCVCVCVWWTCCSKASWEKNVLSVLTQLSTDALTPASKLCHRTRKKRRNRYRNRGMEASLKIGLVSLLPFTIMHQGHPHSVSSLKTLCLYALGVFTMCVCVWEREIICEACSGRDTSDYRMQTGEEDILLSSL